MYLCADWSPSWSLFCGVHWLEGSLVFQSSVLWTHRNVLWRGKKEEDFIWDFKEILVILMFYWEMFHQSETAVTWVDGVIW